ncbi:uncharacterized protein LOC110723577 isoform X1 [Chenopodium quinoa]|uniref:uncharacterized protein LOC110723577 isoform X1 n=1 Tax=Chenopodium quinoa TaxID=63459 RepID=UPI000B778421|nr:uncharacterized protein LOC110723577 isoform X1 [Chenopodium quinoa]
MSNIKMSILVDVSFLVLMLLIAFFNTKVIVLKKGIKCFVRLWSWNSAKQSSQRKILSFSFSRYLKRIIIIWHVLTPPQIVVQLRLLITVKVLEKIRNCLKIWYVFCHFFFIINILIDACHVVTRFFIHVSSHYITGTLTLSEDSPLNFFFLP